MIQGNSQLTHRIGESMIKRLNESFTETEHAALSKGKDDLRKKLNRSKLSWHDYLLHISEVKKIGRSD